tara:strand:+ start:9188 stop:10774 length:1587 start_codon:yes stop_codon:yes gene_type:complete
MMASLDSFQWFLDSPARVLGERHRWVSLGLGIAVQLCAGTLYSVSAWGVALRGKTGWANDEDLSLATTVGTLGVYLAVHNGLALDQFGARPCLVFSSIALFTGWHLLAHVASSEGSPAAAAFALGLIGQGSVTAFLASLAPNVGNFNDKDQGKVHGVLLAGFGGSSALFSVAYRSAFVGNLPGFFGFAGWVTSFVAACNAYATLDGTRTGNRARNNTHSSGIGLTKLPSTPYRELREDELRLVSEGNSSTVEVSDEAQGGREESNSKPPEDSAAMETEQNSGEHAVPSADATYDTANQPLPIHLKRLFASQTFWVIYAHLVLTLGTALLWVNQAGPFAVVADEKVNAQSASLATLVILFSLGNVCGRVFCGAASDFCESKFGAPRSVFLIIGAVAMCFGAGALASSPGREEIRNAVAVVVGLAEGTIMASWTSTVRSVFGEERFGLHLAIYNSALALGSSAFNGFAAVATADPGVDGNGEVLGYKATFAVATTACGGATLLGLAIVKATKREAEEVRANARRRGEMDG